MDKVIKKAIEVIEKNKIKIGIKAGFYYPDFWIRDALISSMGIVHFNSEFSKKLIKNASKYQKKTGQIANKISPDGKIIDFGEGGCVDSSLWLPISSYYVWKITEDKKFLSQMRNKAVKSVKWVLNLDINNDGLIETTEGSDWMDMLLRSGRVLYDNVLLYGALKYMGKIEEVLGKDPSFWFGEAEKVRESINLLMWLSEENKKEVEKRFGYTGIEKDYEIALRSGEKNYYIADLGFRKYDPRFDVFANVLAVFFGVPDEEKKKRIFESFETFKVSEPYPIKVLVPPIYRDDPFWSFYFRETDLGFLQDPGNFHNGGIWPFAGGFYVALLKKESLEWESELKKLADAVMIEEKFYEWINPFNGRPGGSPYQTWSAAMFLFAIHFDGKI